MQELLLSLIQLVLLLFNPVILLMAIIVIVVLVKKNKEYKNGSYYQITKLPYHSVKHDIGRYGEYLTYKYLKQFESNGAKFLFNVYIPKENGETTEIDVLMICSNGIFVFESKNYSGWIFGSESQKNWYQTLPSGRGRSHKEHFYNPIMQNRSHIKHLKAFLNKEIPMYSVITFSERCTLKSVQIKSNDISVINRYNVAPVVSQICNQIPNDLLSETEITNIYNKLFPYTQVDCITKAQHITNIHNKLNQQEAVLDTSVNTPIQQIEKTADISTEESKIENVIRHQADILEDNEEAEHSVVLKELRQVAEGEEILKCPKCNEMLILRTAARGTNAGNQFYGCSNYPKCKYIQNIAHIAQETKKADF